MNPLDIAMAYHEETKHHWHRYARSPGGLDWANEPNPFRIFEGAPTFALPIGKRDLSPPYDDIYAADTLAPRAVSCETISEFYYLSLSIAAWKQHGEARWALRCNPSSGNLHPTEGYLIIGPLDPISDKPAVYHYLPREHGLARRTVFSLETWRRLSRGFPAGTFFAGLSSVYWREAWKYGERAYRYSQMDMGHALAAYAIAATTLGWHARWLCELSDADSARLLGLHHPEQFTKLELEYPELVVAVVPGPIVDPIPARLDADAIDCIANGDWLGRPNRLSQTHVRWDRIDAVAGACCKPRTDATAFGRLTESPAIRRPGRGNGASARTIIRQRRSAVQFDCQTPLSRERFYTMMARVLPHAGRVPFETLGPPASIHLAMFVHRVTGLEAGLYCLVRSSQHLDALRHAMRPEFVWQVPPDCPDTLPLFLLQPGGCKTLAKRVSCHQDIAGDGAFSLGMIGEFEKPLRRFGAWYYRRLHWEAGVIGQVLYLEAEAAGIRATGMGCYFDDQMHDAFGLTGRQYQSMYHFTAGGPIEDTRLTALPAYGATR
ncbi:MAG: SagB/ThcOx family dehydrogenase [Planctomycetota bacterium]|nr:SagB/ThcOx family dehydrogenase [Planctomycetota bacterium]